MNSKIKIELIFEVPSDIGKILFLKDDEGEKLYSDDFIYRELSRYNTLFGKSDRLKIKVFEPKTASNDKG